MGLGLDSDLPRPATRRTLDSVASKVPDGRRGPRADVPWYSWVCPIFNSRRARHNLLKF